MIAVLARDAVRIKMAAKEESPLISAYEFCYAAGLGCRAMHVAQEEAEALIASETFVDFKTRIQDKVKDASDLFGAVPNGERLLSLIRSCRFRGEMDEDARALFQMGYLGE